MSVIAFSRHPLVEEKQQLPTLYFKDQYPGRGLFFDHLCDLPVPNEIPFNGPRVVCIALQDQHEYHLEVTQKGDRYPYILGSTPFLKIWAKKYPFIWLASKEDNIAREQAIHESLSHPNRSAKGIKGIFHRNIAGPISVWMNTRAIISRSTSQLGDVTTKLFGTHERADFKVSSDIVSSVHALFALVLLGEKNFPFLIMKDLGVNGTRITQEEPDDL